MAPRNGGTKLFAMYEMPGYFTLPNKRELNWIEIYAWPNLNSRPYLFTGPKIEIHGNRTDEDIAKLRSLK